MLRLTERLLSLTGRRLSTVDQGHRKAVRKNRGVTINSLDSILSAYLYVPDVALPVVEHLLQVLLHAVIEVQQGIRLGEAGVRQKAEEQIRILIEHSDESTFQSAYTSCSQPA